MGNNQPIKWDEKLKKVFKTVKVKTELCNVFSNVCGEPFGVLVKQQNESRIISYMLMMAFFLSYRCDICPRDSRLTGSLLLSAHALLARWELLRCWVNNRMNGNIKARPSWYIGPALRKKSALWYSPSPFLYRKKNTQVQQKITSFSHVFYRAVMFRKKWKKCTNDLALLFKKKMNTSVFVECMMTGWFFKKNRNIFPSLKKTKKMCSIAPPLEEKKLCMWEKLNNS